MICAFNPCDSEMRKVLQSKEHIQMIHNLFNSSNIEESHINMELEGLMSKLPVSVPAHTVPVPSAGINKVPADEIDPLNTENDHKRRQKLKRY